MRYDASPVGYNIKGPTADAVGMLRTCVASVGYNIKGPTADAVGMQKSRLKDTALGKMKTIGLAALGCYAIHAGFHIIQGRPEESLWMCHLGAALVGIGLLLGSATANGIGTLFLCLGTPLWVMYLVGGGEFYPTSSLPHLAGLAIGLIGVRRLGLPSGTWWKSVATLITLILLCRLVTPAQSNVNVAFAIYAGWEKTFPSHLVYIIAMMVQSAVYFFGCEYALRRWLAPKREPGSAGILPA